MTPHPRLGAARPSRRGFLTGGLAASFALSSCAYIRDDVAVDAPLPPSAKAEIDGDLVYFNWADYLAPRVIKGFQEEYGVKVIESNFDSMEGMYAKIAAGNQYDIVFPIAKWVVKLRREGKLRAIDPAQLTNADQVFYSGSYFNEPWYDAGSRVSVPFTVYKTGIGWRTDKVSSMTGSWHDLWNEEAAGHIFTLDDQDEALAMAALTLGYDVNTAKPSELEEMKKLLISQKDLLRAYSSDDINDMTSGDAWVHHMWSGDFLYLRNGLANNPTKFDFEAPVEGVPINSDTYAIPTNAQHPGTAMVFIDYLLRPENAIKNMKYLYYPFPVRDALPAFADLAKDVPACNVEVSDLENENVFRLLPTDEVQRRAAVWTEVKAS
ncbi:polyamine ABC transporter substrate-binding protein [Nocardioides halotolerans]|uniref:polyamine ABC transporter substrate-binding protein n=1 Tax=Nocardioides halotolerans TaxID=433660 RepID=UPI0004003386|nr:spermidine/putrescine ABC transporter substrate-binding protein [Nocardioides halotolerans]